jgi:hypothetical protein
VNGNSKQSQNRGSAATECRLNQELKFQYMKKQKFNEKLYNIHAENSKEWGNVWSVQSYCAAAGNTKLTYVKQLHGTRVLQ